MDIKLNVGCTDDKGTDAGIYLPVEAAESVATEILRACEIAREGDK